VSWRCPQAIQRIKTTTQKTRHKRDIADHETIEKSRAAVDATPADYSVRAGYLENLGSRLWNRFQTTEALEDLEIAIQTGWQAVAMTPEDHPGHDRPLNNLKSRLRDWFQRTGALKDPDEHDESISDLETQSRLPTLEGSSEYEPSETSIEDGSIFSLPQIISSKSSAHDAVGTTGELVMLLMENTQLRSLYPSLRQKFEFTAFKSKLHQLLRVFSKDLSKEALIPIEKESVHFISQQRRRVSHAIGQEVFGLKDQSLLQSISQRQQLDTREMIERYLKDANQSKGSSDELSLQQEHTSDNDSTDDEDELEPFSNLEHVKKFLIKSKAFENLRIRARFARTHVSWILVITSI
jgi:hypothetical protein